MDIPREIKELNKQLYPTGRAWGYVHGSEQDKTDITYFVDGLGNRFVDGLGNAFISLAGGEASPSKRLTNAFLKSFERYYADAMSILNQILADNEDFDETDASNWERIYGLVNNGLTIEERRQNILLRQSYPNGIEERGNYLQIQNQLQASGFNVYVHENRFPDGAGGWEVQDPDSLATELWQYGTAEYGVAEYGGDNVGIDYTVCANYIDEALDETYFDESTALNEYGVAEYGVAEYETPIPYDRSVLLRATFYISGPSFPSVVTVPLNRKDEFRQLVLKYKPAQTVAFMYINYV